MHITENQKSAVVTSQITPFFFIYYQETDFSLCTALYHENIASHLVAVFEQF